MGRAGRGKGGEGEEERRGRGRGIPNRSAALTPLASVTVMS